MEYKLISSSNVQIINAEMRKLSSEGYVVHTFKVESPTNVYTLYVVLMEKEQ